MNNALMLAGRILIAIIMVTGGWAKLFNQAGITAYIASAGIPVPTLAWITAVFVELVVGLALLFGLFTRASALVLAAWCMVTAAIYHGNFAAPGMQIQFLKNTAMAGGLLYVVAFGAGAYSLDALLARRRPVMLTTA